MTNGEKYGARTFIVFLEKHGEKARSFFEDFCAGNPCVFCNFEREYCFEYWKNKQATD